MTEVEWLSTSDVAAMVRYVYPHAVPSPRIDGRVALATDRQMRAWVEACRLSSTPKNIWAFDLKTQLQEAVMDWTEYPSSVGAAILRDLVNPWKPTIGLDEWPTHFSDQTVLALAKRAGEPVAKECEFCEGRKIVTTGRAFHVQKCNPCNGAGQIITGTLDPVRLAVLADCLEDEGCTEEALLRHLKSQKLCHGCSLPGQEKSGWCEVCDTHQTDSSWVPDPAPHYVGCWAVSLLTGEPE